MASPYNNPYAPPDPQQQETYGARAQQGAWGHGGPPRPQFMAYVMGDDLVLSKMAPLPHVCVKCGTTGGITMHKRKFTWVSPWVYLLAIVSVLIAAIVAAILQKRGELWVPLCASCKSRWTTATLAIVFTVLGIIPAIALPAIIGSSFDAGGATVLMVVLGIVLWIVSVVLVSIFFARPRTLIPKKIDDYLITLRGVHPVARDAICQAAAAYATQPPSWAP
jgi:hypothetical protein